MKKNLLTVAALALLTAACSGPLCQTRGCQADLKQNKADEETAVLSDSAVQKDTTTVKKAKNPVLFKFGSAELTLEGKAALDPYVKYMQKHDDKKAFVSGYTDNIGEEAYNLELSKQRAESAKAYLVEKGVNAERVTTAGYGETNFIASNDTPAGRAKNRRIELRFK